MLCELPPLTPAILGGEQRAKQRKSFINNYFLSPMNSPSLYPTAKETFSLFPFNVIIRDAHDYTLKQERERVIAQLCIELIEHYGYQSHQILINEFIPIPSVSGKTYLECDVMVNDGNQKVLLIKTGAPKEYDRGYESAFNHLFQLGRAYQGKEKDISEIYLIYYTRMPDHGSISSRCMTIDFSRYSDVASWSRASKPTSSEIPFALGKK